MLIDRKFIFIYYNHSKIIYMCQNAKCDYRFVSNKSN